MRELRIPYPLPAGTQFDRGSSSGTIATPASKAHRYYTVDRLTGSM